jgi:hypothetical protein
MFPCAPVPPHNPAFPAKCHGCPRAVPAAPLDHSAPLSPPSASAGAKEVSHARYVVESARTVLQILQTLHDAHAS